MYSLTPVLLIHLFSREENKHHVFRTVNDSLIIKFLLWEKIETLQQTGHMLHIGKQGYQKMICLG